MSIFGKQSVKNKPDNPKGKDEKVGVVEMTSAGKSPAPVAEAHKPAPVEKPSDTPAEAHGSKLVVGPDIRLLGSEITDCDTIIVEGWVEATVDGRVMQISEKGTFTGTVSIDVADIRGHFKGELTVRKRLTVCSTGKVSGKIRYGKLVVEEGGELSGDISGLGGETAAQAKPVQASNEPELPLAKQDESWESVLAVR